MDENEDKCMQDQRSIWKDKKRNDTILPQDNISNWYLQTGTYLITGHPTWVYVNPINEKTTSLSTWYAKVR